ncbi:uncharacterized protein CDV56_100997 [Aspergillus thermomutatus]|uniref:FAD/NAD(P)-binding domain-containing protein n=1 Tax=Aspergillus thermomutatus TaxID=41047 RepID=A0A397GV20_ASPTH|nr:uncharacterized protein CDV56_100997 [Aspergillus thermomutatus]RHZ54871.1 hypothetical protein CDV56_100997 [Aspergillus thermomutatus]ULE36156.1 ThmL [Aspergillus thermomutatus]
MGLFNNLVIWFYEVIQFFIAQVFAPNPRQPRQKVFGPRIAIIAAGITGVSSAAHCVGHGFDVTLFEAKGREHLGGIWSQVNNTSSLQIHSVMYRFHPSVRFKQNYPDRQGILREVTHLWERYGLQSRTEFNVCVESVWRDKESGKWYVQHQSYGQFDGVISAVGTCGDPKMPHIPGQENSQGQIYHSSNLTGKDVKGKRLLVVGGGASAIEAVEFAVSKQAAKTSILARTNKWIIPRNPFIDGLLALNIFGEETSLGWVPEWLLKKFFYRDLSDLAPAKAGLYTETPMVNNDILEQVRSGRIAWLRGDIKEFQEKGVLFNHREKVGNIHIGLYTRLLLMFIVDPSTRPSLAWMHAWVDWTRAWKQGSPGGALEFFTYSELVGWIVLSLASNPFRWKWILFVLGGWGNPLPPSMMHQEGSPQQRSTTADGAAEKPKAANRKSHKPKNKTETDGTASDGQKAQNGMGDAGHKMNSGLTGENEDKPASGPAKSGVYSEAVPAFVT